MIKVWFVFILVFHGVIVEGQDSSSYKDSSAAKLKVFIDCRGDCDEDFIKSEIPIVDFVVDRSVADVHVLITFLQVGSGGDQYEVNLYGQNAFSYFIDTLHYTSRANASKSDVREGLVHYLMLGLAPLLARTSFADDIKISMKGQDAGVEIAPDTTNVRDKWNYWVYTVDLTGELNADQVYKTSILGSEVSAHRKTDKMKATLAVRHSRNRTLYTYAADESTTTYIVKNQEYGVYHNLVKSISGHWSVGYQLDLSNNTFTNIKSKIYLNPAIEYNFFDVKEVNDRLFVLRYGIDLSNNRYYDTSVFNKISETLYGHQLAMMLTLNKKFGTVNTGVYYHEFFNNRKLYSMGINANADIKISGALSFIINVDASVAHDQVNLVKSNATEKEVFTRKRQIASTFNYQSSIGIKFRFGSVLNNFVNPRFEGYAGF